MEIVELNKDRYEEWDKFCLESDDAWFWHTTDWLEYSLKYRPECESQSFSFMLCKGKEVLAICPLVLENISLGNEKHNEFYNSAFYGGMMFPAIRNGISIEQRQRILEEVFECIDKLARENEVERSTLQYSPLTENISKNKKSICNELMEYGYIDISLNSRLVDLRLSEDRLMDDLRRNHRRNILKQNQAKIKIYTKDNITKNMFYEYKETHHKAAGRKTRPDITFEMMCEWILKGYAMLAVVEYKDNNIGFELYITYKGNAYGLSAANKPEFEDVPVRHKLEWEAIKWMKMNDFCNYEIGLQQFGILPYDFPSQKHIDISRFKNGFGGFNVALFRGEKYYSKKHYEEIDAKRKTIFLEQYNFENQHLKEKTASLVEMANKPKAEKKEIREAIEQIVQEDANILINMTNDDNIKNYFFGKMKGKLKNRFNFNDIQEVLGEVG